VANGTLGRAYQVDLDSPQVVRSADLATAASTLVELAKFDGAPGTTGRLAALSPDGSALYVVGPAGLRVVSTRDLSSGALLLAGQVLSGVGISPDGRMLFALERGGRIVTVDAATGAVLGAFDGSGYDAILRVIGGRP